MAFVVAKAAAYLAMLGPCALLGASASQAEPTAIAPSFLGATEALERNGTTRLRGSSVTPTPRGHPSASKDYPQYSGFTLWLAEEFDEPLDLDTDPIWTWSDGGLGEGQVRFTKENLVFEDGKLKIVVRDNGETVQPQPQSCSYAETGQVAPKALTSGEMRTRHNMFRYGIYETRMKAPSVQPGDSKIDGNYIATMFAYRDAKFKHWREIDVEVTGNTERSLTMNVLNAENTESWSTAIQATQRFEAEEGVNVREDFHNFAFVWLPTGITWFFDGVEVGHHGPEKALPIPELSTKIMMNLWIFREGYGFGGPDGENNRYPMHSEYDWFRFYKWDGDLSYPCEDGSDACLTADDRYLSANNPCDGIDQVGLRGGEPSCRAECSGSAASISSSAESSESSENSTLFP